MSNALAPQDRNLKLSPLCEVSNRTYPAFGQLKPCNAQPAFFPGNGGEAINFSSKSPAPHRGALRSFLPFDLLSEHSLLNLLLPLSAMSPLKIPLYLISSIAALAHCTVEFFISQDYDQCARDKISIGCANNTDSGGLCAHAWDANMLWRCPAPDPSVLHLKGPLRPGPYAQKS